MGPVVSEQQLRTGLDAIDRARQQGATVAAGGTEPDGLRLEPTVLTDVAHDFDVARNEVFGPVVAVIGVDDYDEGLALINDSPYGLTAGICTTSLRPRTTLRPGSRLAWSRPTAQRPVSISAFRSVESRPPRPTPSASRDRTPWTSTPGARPSTWVTSDPAGPAGCAFSCCCEHWVTELQPADARGQLGTICFAGPNC